MSWLPVILLLPYFFLCIKIFSDLLRIRPFIPDREGAAKISVVIACRNEEDNLPSLIDCLALQDYPNDLFEVIIVDDNSTDRTFEIVSAKKKSVRLFAMRNKGTGKKEAIRTGINGSSGNLIITTDADCRMGKSWISTIAAFFDEYRPDMIIGPVMLNTGSGFFSKIQGLEYLGLQGITAGTAYHGNGTMCNGANLAFKRSAYLDHMDNLHFEIASGDDVFLLHSIKKETNSKILWLESAEALVTTAAAQTMFSFLRQRRRWISKWKVYNDNYTRLTAIFTFSAIILQLSVLVALCFFHYFIWLFFVILILKSVPDFLITYKTAGRYSRKELMYWFLPVQLIYPFYVIIVFLATMIPWAGKKS